MRLTLSEAAELLQTPEPLLEDLVVHGGLPAFRMHDRFWVNRAELLEWAASRGVPFSRRLYSAGTSDLASALAQGRTYGGLPASSLEATLRALVEGLPLRVGVDRSELLEMILARELEEPTVIPPGFLLPHARMPAVLDVDEPLLAVGYPAQALRVGSHDICAVFMLVTPSARAHLHLLARLARALHEPSFCKAVEEHAELERLLELAAVADEPLSVR